MGYKSLSPNTQQLVRQSMKDCQNQYWSEIATVIFCRLTLRMLEPKMYFVRECAVSKEYDTLGSNTAIS